MTTGVDGLQILPLAITMMVGPQIMSAIIFVTAPQAVRVSLGFLAGVAVATTAGTAIMMGIATAIGSAVDLGDSSDGGSVGKIIQYVLVALLAAAALKNWIKRESIEPPKWLGTLMTASPRKAFTIGLLVILLMPSDIVIMMTVGFHLVQGDDSFAEALPFIALTVLVAALPLLLRLLFAGHAATAMPKIREWMNTHSWLVNIIACVIFIVLILA
ncbi:GAP family protein [Streptomyces sp. S.PNR 29]|uniref:GAP family protein n=1 Tax=Streptomyces sp. S.PNR 29 TaxID=2973805 RepID=UPI0025B1C219|nr:GAP family protein [Streptomyces sp. S.PNR 29]MDN0194232.1 GAP family protein [Streptomyces sp. S.PNR 29]